MKKLVLCLALCAFVFSCSDDKENTSIEGQSITSRILAPNGVDPIPNARVTLSKNGNTVDETTTAVDGTFTVNGIQEGTYNLEISKGLFSVQRTIDPETIDEIIEFIFENLPNIAVVTGYYDNVESILYDIGLVDTETGEPLFDIIDGNSGLDRVNGHHGHGHHNSQLSRDGGSLEPNVEFSFEELINSPELLASYDIIFLNCGLSEFHTDSTSNLTDYVTNGGILYATDYAFVYLDNITNSGEDYLTFLQPERSGVSLQTEAEILDNVLTEWLEENYGISVDGTVYIDEFLPAWQVVGSSDEDSVIRWFNGEVTFGTDDGDVTENKDLMFTFLHGEGAVFYSSFHSENHDEGFSDVDRIMQYQIFDLADR